MRHTVVLINNIYILGNVLPGLEAFTVKLSQDKNMP